MKRVMTIAGSDSAGGAGVQADLKIIASMGAHGMSAITALTAQNSKGIQSIYPVPLNVIEAQMDAIFSDTGADAIKTGMLWNGDVVRLVVRKLIEYGAGILIVDPIITATDGTPLLDKDGQNAVRKELLHLACLVTPNLPEAAVLTGLEVRTVEEMKEAARRIHGYGVGAVLVKGGHLDGDPVDVLFDGSGFMEFKTRRIGVHDIHGTGCVLSAAITTALARGVSLREAVEQGRELTIRSISQAVTIGKGRRFASPPASNITLGERAEVIEALQKAIVTLQNEANIGDLMPEVSSNLGYALTRAQSKEDVAAFPGRIVRLNDTITTLDTPALGVSQHIASIILSVMRHDPAVRSAMNIRFSYNILQACQKAGLLTCGFDRRQEPQEISQEEGHSLAWGIERVLSTTDKIPDVIYDEGGWGKEPMIRVLGKDPQDVVRKIIAIHRRHNDGDANRKCAEG
jgi:hydroxymethylpyrimidine kinase / phosphomethylpyrimidine kinase / thiamine-phosphate diphosphorylase